MLKSLLLALAAGAVAIPAVAYADNDSDSTTFRNQRQCLRAIAFSEGTGHDSREFGRSRRDPAQGSGNFTCEQNADGSWSIVSAGGGLGTPG